MVRPSSTPVVDNILELQSIYEVLFELQDNYGLNQQFRSKINGDFATVESVELTNSSNDVTYDNELLKELLKSLTWARDKIITWSVRKSIMELDATIALLSAKIKLIQFILGQCDGVELHQVCSLALVYFKNILEDSVVYNKDREDGRVTLRDVSKKAQLPAWLNHYRNMICHESTMGPCSSILYILVEKSMNYMQRIYWSPVLDLKTFDATKCNYIITLIANARVKDLERIRTEPMSNNLSIQTNLRRFLKNHREETIRVLTEFLLSDSPNSMKKKNLSPLFMEIFNTGCFGIFVNQLLSKVESKQNKKRALNWLSKTLGAGCYEKRKNRTKSLKKMGLRSEFVKFLLRSKNPPLKPLECARIAYRLVHLRHHLVSSMLVKMKRRLVRAMGLERAQLLIQMTKLVLGDKNGTCDKKKSSNKVIEVIQLE